ncbi:hypothetical protein, partial [Pseudoflavonifractor sp. 524-17]|uniref:hypothetical protein n=1 Tax=Pseudoflavonifractor sp. 524-17 TaxID=2304577 RepID=UPI00137A257C
FMSFHALHFISSALYTQSLSFKTDSKVKAIIISMFPSSLNQFARDVPFSPKAVPAPGFSAALSFPLVRSCHGVTSPGTASLWDGHSVVEVVFCSVLTKHMKSSYFTPCSLDCLQVSAKEDGTAEAVPSNSGFVFNECTPNREE